MGNHNISLINGGSVTPAKSRAYVNGMFLVASSQNLADSNAVGVCYLTAKKVQRQSSLQGGLIQHLDNIIKGPVPTLFHAQHWPCSQAGWERVTAAHGVISEPSNTW